MGEVGEGKEKREWGHGVMRVDSDDVGVFLKLMGSRRAVLNVSGVKGKNGRGYFLGYMKMARKSHVYVGVFHESELRKLSGLGVKIYDIDRLCVLF